METETDETIITDISEENDELEQPALTGNDLAMQQILAEREEELKREQGKIVEEEDLEPEPGPIEDEFVTVKVNGRVYEVEAEKVERAGGVEAYQRNAAASEKQRQIAAGEAALAQREAELAEMERKLLNPDPQPKQVDDGEFGKTFADQVFDDPEAIASTMNELNSRTRKAEETTQELLQRLKRQEEKEIEQEKKAQQEVVQYFWSNHEAIASDAEFTDALNARTGTVAAENPTFTQQQVIDAAAEQVYSKFSIAREPGKKPKQDTGRKPVRTAPRASSRKPPTPEVKQKTPDETVRELAKFRTPQRQ